MTPMIVKLIYNLIPFPHITCCNLLLLHWISYPVVTSLFVQLSTGELVSHARVSPRAGCIYVYAYIYVCMLKCANKDCYIYIYSCLTEHLATSEPQNPLIDVSEQHKIRMDRFQGSKLAKCLVRLKLS